MKAMRKESLMLPANYGAIGREEAYRIKGGIGPTAYTKGSYDTHEKASNATKKWEGFFESLFNLDYKQRDTVSKGFGLLGFFQTIFKALNPTAHVEAVNSAPLLTGIFDALGQIGLSRM